MFWGRPLFTSCVWEFLSFLFIRGRFIYKVIAFYWVFGSYFINFIGRNIRIYTLLQGFITNLRDIGLTSILLSLRLWFIFFVLFLQYFLLPLSPVSLFVLIEVYRTLSAFFLYLPLIRFFLPKIFEYLPTFVNHTLVGHEYKYNIEINTNITNTWASGSRNSTWAASWTRPSRRSPCRSKSSISWGRGTPAAPCGNDRHPSCFTTIWISWRSPGSRTWGARSWT